LPDGHELTEVMLQRATFPPVKEEGRRAKRAGEGSIQVAREIDPHPARFRWPTSPLQGEEFFAA